MEYSNSKTKNLTYVRKNDVLEYVFEPKPKKCVNCEESDFELIIPLISFRAYWKCKMCGVEYHIKGEI